MTAVFLEGWMTDQIIVRQKLLYASVPRCIACSNEQVQLVYTGTPAQWKCRVCKCKFEKEPETR